MACIAAAVIISGVLIGSETASGTSSRSKEGPWNLIIKWGNGSPIVIKYQSLERCNLAELSVIVQRDPRFNEQTDKIIPVDPAVENSNAPYAFCIPA